MSREDTVCSQLHAQRVVQRWLQVCHVHPGTGVRSKTQTRVSTKLRSGIEVLVLLATFIPVEGSPGLVCSVGEALHGGWWRRFPWSHHPRQPLEGVRVKNTSLDVAERGEESFSSLFHLLRSILVCIYVNNLLCLFNPVLVSAAPYHKVNWALYFVTYILHIKHWAGDTTTVLPWKIETDGHIADY